MYREHPPKQANELALPWLWQMLAWLMVTGVVIVTLMPKPPPAPYLLGWDKSQHFIAYAVLMWWFVQAFRATPRSAGFLIALGIVLELIQGWSGYRHPEYFDALANTLGVAGGLLLALTPAGNLISWLDRMIFR